MSASIALENQNLAASSSVSPGRWGRASRRGSVWWASAALVLTGLSPFRAGADSPPPSERDSLLDNSGSGGKVRAHLDTIGRLNPIGLVVLAGVYYRHVWDHNRELDFDAGYVQLGATGMFSPAFLQPAAYVDVVPLPFLVLRAEYALQAFLGANRALLRFDDAKQPFGDAALDNRRVETGLAHRLRGSATLRAKVGRIVALNEATLYYYHFNASGPYFYESEFDTLLEPSDVLWADRLQLGVDVSAQDGPRMTLVGPFYELTQAGAADLRRQRLGAYAFWEDDISWLGFASVRLYGLAGVNLEDRNREGGIFVLLGGGGDIGG
jgi:hypothetical protein